MVEAGARRWLDASATERPPDCGKVRSLAEWLYVVLVGAVGLAVGSFVNVVADRLPEGKSLLSPPSHCPECDRRLRALDLVPVFSYLALRGRCRYCKSPIPMRLMLVEAATGIGYGAVWYAYGGTIQAYLLLGYLTFFLAVFLIDLERQIIPNLLVIPALAAALAASALLTDVGLVNALIGAGVGFGIMLALYLIPGMVIGEGDVKLAAVIGAATGFPVIVFGIAASFVLGGMVALALLVAKLKSRKDTMSFGPYMALAAMAAIVWGKPVADWYLRSFWPF
jgi:leader peptidase (prepilin peptidase)/N-methyltransferase